MVSQKINYARGLALTVAAGIALVLAAHGLRWPAGKDVFYDLKIGWNRLGARIPADSPVMIRVVALPDDHFNYLRYFAIPRPLKLKPEAARTVLLATPMAHYREEARRLLRQNPALRVRDSFQTASFRMGLFQAPQ